MMSRTATMAAATVLVAGGLLGAGAASASATAKVSPSSQSIVSGQSATWTVRASQTVYIDWGQRTPLYKHAAGTFKVSHKYSPACPTTYTQHFYIGGTDITTHVRVATSGPGCN